MSKRPAAGRRGLLIALLGLLTVISTPYVPGPGRAAAADPVTVNTDDASSDFPNGIKFDLDVDSARPVMRIELLYQAADLETLNLEVPDFTPGIHVALSHEVDFRVNYQPSGVDITYHWRFTDDQGNVTETAPKTLLWSDNRFDWKPVSSQDVTVYGYTQNDAFDKIILNSAQSTIDKLKVEYGVETVTPIRIWVYNSKQDFSATQQGNSSEWIAGTAFPQLHVILAILPEGNQREVGRVVPHEISHQMLYQATKNPFNGPPTWFDEGLAVYHQDNGNEDFPALVKDAAEKGRLFSIRALNSNFPYDASDATLAYAESYTIIQFIIDTYGQDKLSAVIAAYRQGVSHDDALRIGLGVDIDQLDQLWKASLGYQGNSGSRVAGSTHDSSPWVDFFGSGLAGGTLILLFALVIVGAHRLSSHRRLHHHLSPPV